MMSGFYVQCFDKVYSLTKSAVRIIKCNEVNKILKVDC
jgi:hypothetical protein